MIQIVWIVFKKLLIKFPSFHKFKFAFIKVCNIIILTKKILKNDPKKKSCTQISLKLHLRNLSSIYVYFNNLVQFTQNIKYAGNSQLDHFYNLHTYLNKSYLREFSENEYTRLSNIIKKVINVSLIKSIF